MCCWASKQIKHIQTVYTTTIHLSQSQYFCNLETYNPAACFNHTLSSGALAKILCWPTLDRNRCRPAYRVFKNSSLRSVDWIADFGGSSGTKHPRYRSLNICVFNTALNNLPSYVLKLLSVDNWLIKLLISYCNKCGLGLVPVFQVKQRCQYYYYFSVEMSLWPM